MADGRDFLLVKIFSETQVSNSHFRNINADGYEMISTHV